MDVHSLKIKANGPEGWRVQVFLNDEEIKNCISAIRVETNPTGYNKVYLTLEPDNLEIDVAAHIALILDSGNETR
jgi:hypothetical protein